VEIRFRRRYVDLVVNPEVRDVFVKRSLIIRSCVASWTIRIHGSGNTGPAPHCRRCARPAFKTHHNALDHFVVLADCARALT